MRRSNKANSEEGGKRPSVHIRIERHFWGHVLAGFLVLLPLFVTIIIIQFVYVSIEGFYFGEGGIFHPVMPDNMSIGPVPIPFPGLGVIITLILFYIFGTLMTIHVGRRAVDVKVAILSHIPVVKSIYGVAKQATDSLTTPSGHEVSRVVFVEWPRAGNLALGFTTGQSQPSDEDDTELIVVYIPTVPNPTSGNLAFVPEEKVYESTLTVEQAMKTVFSGGVVVPGNLGMLRSPFFDRARLNKMQEIEAAANEANRNLNAPRSS